MQEMEGICLLPFCLLPFCLLSPVSCLYADRRSTIARQVWAAGL